MLGLLHRVAICSGRAHQTRVGHRHCTWTISWRWKVEDRTRGHRGTTRVASSVECVAGAEDVVASRVWIRGEWPRAACTGSPFPLGHNRVDQRTRKHRATLSRVLSTSGQPPRRRSTTRTTTTTGRTITLSAIQGAGDSTGTATTRDKGRRRGAYLDRSNKNADRDLF